MPTLEATDRRSTATTDELLDALEKYRPPMLTEIELRHRVGGTVGRFSSLSQAVIRPSKDDTPETTHAFILAHCEKVEEEHGPCVFKATFKVATDNGTRTPPPVTFDLHGSTMGDPKSEAIGSYVNALKASNEANARLMSALEKTVGFTLSTAEACAKLASASAEVKRVEYEHADRMASREAEDRESEREHETVREVLPKLAATMAARNARKEAAKGNSKPKASWRHLKDTAATIRARGGLPDDLLETLDAMAHADSREAMQGLVGQLKRGLAAAHIDPYAFLAKNPEILEHADAFV